MAAERCLYNTVSTCGKNLVADPGTDRLLRPSGYCLSHSPRQESAVCREKIATTTLQSWSGLRERKKKKDFVTTVPKLHLSER